MGAVDRIIAKFGSQTALAEAVGVDQSAVSLWKRSGFIPARRQPAVLKAAKERGIALGPQDFFEGEEPTEAAE